MSTTNAAAVRPDRARDGERRVELWVRAPPIWTEGGRAGLVERLERLESAGWLDHLVIRTWGPTVDATRPRTSRDAVVRNRVAAFREWARRTGRALPGFETVRTADGRMGPDRDVVHLPTVTLAAYRGGAVELVAPVADGTGLHTTADWVADAERRAFGESVDGVRDDDGDEGEHASGAGRRRYSASPA